MTVWDEITTVANRAGKIYARHHGDNTLGFCAWCGWCLDCHPEHATGLSGCDRDAPC